MDKLEKGISLIVTIIIIAIVVVGVGYFFITSFDEIKEAIGFGIDLTPEEIEAQNKAKNIFNDNLIPILEICKESKTSNCFCSNKEIIFPTDYSLVFVNEIGGFDISLNNQNGGKVSDALISDVVGCFGIYGESLKSFNGLKNNILNIKYTGNEFYLTFMDIPLGNEIREPINPNYIFYKPKNDKNYICILDSDSVSEKIDKIGVCS